MASWKSRTYTGIEKVSCSSLLFQPVKSYFLVRIFKPFWRQGSSLEGTSVFTTKFIFSFEFGMNVSIRGCRTLLHGFMLYIFSLLEGYIHCIFATNCIFLFFWLFFSYSYVVSVPVFVLRAAWNMIHIEFLGV